MVRGQGGNYPDGWVYAMATEREFNATNLIMGRSRPDVADMTDPTKWQWVSGLTGAGQTPQIHLAVRRCDPDRQLGLAHHLSRRWPTTRRCTSTC